MDRLHAESFVLKLAVKESKDHMFESLRTTSTYINYPEKRHFPLKVLASECPDHLLSLGH